MKDKDIDFCEKAIELAQDIVKIPSEAPPGEEKAVAEKLAEVLSGGGLETKLVEAAPGRPNVLATLRGMDKGPTLLYQGHIDVVPVGDVSLWSVPPYGGIIRDGKLYGRGASDMKSGVAAMAAAAMALKRQNVPLKGNLVLAFVVDEEVSNLGIKKLIEDGLAADWAVVGEPTSLDIALGHRGVIAFKVRTYGRAAHAAQAQAGVNAIDKAFSFRSEIEKLRETISGRSNSLLGNPSLNLTTIKGGTKVNIIPDFCEMTLDRRLIPGETREAVESEIRALIKELAAKDPEFKADFTVTTCVAPGEIVKDHPLVQTLSEAVLQAMGKMPQFKGFEATCEASIIIEAMKTPIVIFGPGRIAQAHCADEYVDIEQIAKATASYIELAKNLLTE